MLINRDLFDKLFGMLGEHTQEEAATYIGTYLEAAKEQPVELQYKARSLGITTMMRESGSHAVLMSELIEKYEVSRSQAIDLLNVGMSTYIQMHSELDAEIARYRAVLTNTTSIEGQS